MITPKELRQPVRLMRPSVPIHRAGALLDAIEDRLRPMIAPEHPDEPAVLALEPRGLAE